MNTFRTLMIAALLTVSLAHDTLAQAQEIPLGSSLPLQDQAFARVGGSSASLKSLAGSTATVVVFWSNQCPWVDKVTERVQALAAGYDPAAVRLVLVNANDADAFPQESLAVSAEQGYTMTYLHDTQSELAKAMGAERTPHVYVFDGTQTLVYVGAIDDSPGDAANVKKAYLKDALDALVAGRDIEVPQTKAFGCRLKPTQ